MGMKPLSPSDDIWIGQNGVHRYHQRSQRTTEAVAHWATRLRFRGGGGISSAVWADRGFGKTTEEEGSQQSPSWAPRVAHAPPFHSGSDGRGLFLTILDVSTLKVFRFKEFVAYFGFVNGGVTIFGVGWADQGFRKAKGEEGNQLTHSSVARMAHTPPLLPRSDGREVNEDN
ncbi:hypothetical protein Cgig2_008710 [Carnegiea gigantea]|uniref:Uncharacterized protein n=1 Tax=Carnegiea gigantea TaxID=171969 RepID=A0A9Q1GU79_9CARY|nr:hypothetical protein Cgig2_008710 [Carnegiea gigantea]